MKRLFNNSAISKLRKQNEANLPDLAIVKKPVEGTSEGGGVHAITYVEECREPCRLAASQVGPSPGEVFRLGGTESRIEWVVCLKAGVTIEADRHITVQGTDQLTGVAWSRELEVLAPSDPRTSTIMTKIYCREWK